MAGYNDTRNLIIEALMGRQAGTEIQPEKHQAYALNMLDYVRSVELVSSSTLTGLAEESTVPVQPNNGKVCYIAGVGQDRTVTFNNFIDEEGNPISVTTGEMEGVFVILLWNMEYWTAYTFNTNIISSAEVANFYYGYNIRKTYASIALMGSDSVNPIGTDGRLIKIGELVTVVNSTTPSENGYYSYEGSENGWLLQSGFSFEIVQTTGTDINKTMSQKAVTDELGAKADHGYDAGETPKTLKDVDASVVQLAGEVNLKEVEANKQNSLEADGTGVKFPTVDAVNAMVKQTVGTSTTQVMSQDASTKNFARQNSTSIKDLVITDENDNIIILINNHIKTKDFDSKDINGLLLRDLTIGGEKLKDYSILERHLGYSYIAIRTGVSGVFDIVDIYNNTIARFKDGRLITKYQSPFIKISKQNVFDFIDEEGRVLVRFKDGHIQTKNFNSADVLSNVDFSDLIIQLENYTDEQITILDNLKLDRNLGSVNKGLYLKIDENGDIKPIDITGLISSVGLVTISQGTQNANKYLATDADGNIIVTTLSPSGQTYTLIEPTKTLFVAAPENLTVDSLGTGWSGDLINGLHFEGNAGVCKLALPTSETAFYLIRITTASGDIGGVVTGYVYASFENGFKIDTYNGSANQRCVLKNDGTTNLIVLEPTSGNANNTITEIKVCKIVDEANSVESVVIPFDCVNAGELGGYGTWNVSLGPDALSGNVNGTRNIAIGYTALRRFETGLQNIGIGTFALNYLKNGNRNIAIGADTMWQFPLGDDNVGVGKGSMNASTPYVGNPNKNTAIGNNSLNSLDINGSNNVGVGYSAGLNSKNKCTSIGSDTRANGKENVTLIGYNAIADKNNQSVIGNSQTIETKVFGDLIVEKNGVKIKIIFNADGTCKWQQI